MGVIEYSSNNSGGSWWLSDADWKALEDAGWVVHWVHDEDDPSHTHAPREPSRWKGEHRHSYTDILVRSTPSGERWLGALAMTAAKETTIPESEIAQWERVTGQSASDQGCNCCGPPHSFTYTDDDGNVRYSDVVVTDTSLRWT